MFGPPLGRQACSATILMIILSPHVVALAIVTLSRSVSQCGSPRHDIVSFSERRAPTFVPGALEWRVDDAHRVRVRLDKGWVTAKGPSGVFAVSNEAEDSVARDVAQDLSTVLAQRWAARFLRTQLITVCQQNTQSNNRRKHTTTQNVLMLVLLWS